MNLNWINKSAGVYSFAIKIRIATFTRYLVLFLCLHVYAILIRINHNVVVVLYCIKNIPIFLRIIIISKIGTFKKNPRDDLEISCLEQKMWFYYTEWWKTEWKHWYGVRFASKGKTKNLIYSWFCLRLQTEVALLISTIFRSEGFA